MVERTTTFPIFVCILLLIVGIVELVRSIRKYDGLIDMLWIRDDEMEDEEDDC